MDFWIGPRCRAGTFTSPQPILAGLISKAGVEPSDRFPHDTHISSTGAMIPLLIRSISRYCSSHLTGAGCGFSSASTGNGFLLANFGVVDCVDEVDAGVGGGSSFGFFLGEGEGAMNSALTVRPTGLVTVLMERVDRRSDVNGVEGEVGSCLTAVVLTIVTRESCGDLVELRGVVDILDSSELK